MEILKILSLITAGFTLFYKVTKSLSESISFFWIKQTDNNRLKDDLTDQKKLNNAAFTFAILIISISLTLSFAIVNATKEISDGFPEWISANLLSISFISIATLFVPYVYFIFAKKNKRVLRIKDKKDDKDDKDKKDDKLWYLHLRLTDDTYLFKNSTSKDITKDITKLKIVSKEKMIELFDGYCNVEK